MRAAGLRTDRQHRALGEAGQQVERVAAGAHRLRGAQVERPREHRERGEQLLLVGLEHVVRPADRVVHRAVARVAAAPHRLEQPEALVEPAARSRRRRSTRARAAASSIASGMPSSRRQISTTTGAVVVVERRSPDRRRAPGRRRARPPGSPSRPRATSSRRARPSTAVRPTTPARRRPPAVPGSWRRPTPTALRCRIRLTSAATGSMRCSQLSSSSRLWRGPQHLGDRVVDRAAAPEVDVDRGRERGRRGLLVDDADELDDVDAVGVVRRRPCARARGRREVLPTPPGPTSVIRRCVASASTSSAMSDSRPISGWIAVPRPAIVGDAALAPATAPARSRSGRRTRSPCRGRCG